MKTLQLTILLFILILASCGEEKQNSNVSVDPLANEVKDDSILASTDPSTIANNTATVTPVGRDTVIACFYYDGKETQNRMYMMRVGDYTIGDLQLDCNSPNITKGSFFGNFHGDTLWANYDFLVGTNKSQKEICLLLKGDSMLQGEGTLVDQNGRKAFTSHSKVTFDKKKAMLIGDCSRTK